MNSTCEWYQNAKEKSEEEEKWIKEHTEGLTFFLIGL